MPKVSKRLPNRRRFDCADPIREREHGISFLEILVAVVVIAVLSGLAVAKLGLFHNGHELDEEAKAIYGDFANVRSLALKRDVTYLIRILPDQGRYTVYCDSNANGMADPGEAVATHVLDARVAFGAAAHGPSQGPGGVGNPAAAVESGWAGLIALANDRGAGFTSGALYLHSRNVDARTLCIRMPAGSRRLELWRWDGASWTSL